MSKLPKQSRHCLVICALEESPISIKVLSLAVRLRKRESETNNMRFE